MHHRESGRFAAGIPGTYTRLLGEKGYTVKQLQTGSAVTDWPVTSTHTANWRWDLALYMAYAEIGVFSNGQQNGQAVYDARSGGANMNKFAAKRRSRSWWDSCFRIGRGRRARETTSIPAA